MYSILLSAMLTKWRKGQHISSQFSSSSLFQRFQTHYKGWNYNMQKAKSDRGEAEKGSLILDTSGLLSNLLILDI